MRWLRQSGDDSIRVMNAKFLKKQSHVTGFHPRVLFRSLKGLPAFLRDLKTVPRA